MCFEDIEVDLEKTGLVLLEGINNDSRNLDSNGAGKSVAIVDTIFYSLYGRTLSGMKANEVVMWKRRDCYNEIQFEYDDKEYQIKRKRSGNNIDLKLIIDGKDLSLMDSRMTQKEIDNIISYDVLRSTTIFSGSVLSSFVVAGDKEKKSIISDLLGLGLLEQRQKYTREVLKDIKLKISELDGSISAKNEMIESLQEELEEAQKEDTKSYDKELKQYEQKDIDLQKEQSELKDDITKLDSEIDNMIVQVKQEGKKTADLSMEEEKKIIELQHQKKEIEEMESTMELVKCPICKQDVSKQVLKLYVVELKQKHTEIQKEQEQIKKKYETQKSKSIKIENEVELKRKELKELEAKKNSVRSKISDVRDDINRIHHILQSKEEKINSLIKRVKKTKKELELCEEQKKKYDKQIPVLEFWVNGFSSSGIINFILDLSIPELNMELNRCLSYLFGGDVVAKFKPFSKLKSGEVREKWDFDITGLGSYKSCSSGQKRRLDISVLLALNAILRKRFETNLIVFDEALDPLDGIGIEKTIELIKNLNIPSTFVVTHHPDLKGEFNNIWIVEKKDGISKLIMGG